jgi:signal transduction histidine kinase
MRKKRIPFNQSETILEALPESVIACDREGTIVQINAAARNLFEVPPGALCRGTNYQQFLQRCNGCGKQHQPIFPEQWLMSLATDDSAPSSSPENTLLLHMPSGREVYVNFWRIPVHTAQKHRIETIYAFHDITHRQQKAFHLQRVHEAVLTLDEALAHIQEKPAIVLQKEAFLLSPAVVLVAQPLVDVIRHVLDCLRVSLFTLRFPASKLFYIAGSGLTAEQEQRYQKVNGMSVLLSDMISEAMFTRLRSNQEIILSSDCINRPFVPPGEGETENILMVPLFLKQQLAGGLAIIKARPDNEYQPEEVELVKAVAAQAVLVMDCISCLYEQTKTHTRLLVLHEVNRLGSDFLTLAAHELRTPLTGIKGNLQLAQHRLETLKRQFTEQREHPDERLSLVQKPLDAALRSVLLQEHMLQSVVDDARIQTNQLQSERKRCNLLALLNAAVVRQQQLLPERTIILEIKPAVQDVPVLADAEQITRVLNTYLTNALTYAPPQEPVYAQLTVEAMVARVSIHNEGPGIPLEEQEHLWERFYRARGNAVQHELDLSFGLSLYLCRAFIEQHLGSVGMQSAPGQGTTFWFTLPIASTID